MLTPDFTNSDDITNKTGWSNISYYPKEVLLAFNLSKDKYYCYDPEGLVAHKTYVY
jgi:hypothetical protein